MAATNGTATRKDKLDYTIRPVDPEELKLLRHEVLWPSIPIDSQLADYDYVPGALHLGLFLPTSEFRALSIPSSYDDLPVGIVTLVPTPYTLPLPPSIAESLPDFTGEPATQLRKFALHPNLQGKGLGRVMFDASVEHLRRRDKEEGEERPRLLHLDARTNQTGFYERLGLTVLDPEVFTKVGTNGAGPAIPHLRMGIVI